VILVTKVDLRLRNPQTPSFSCLFSLAERV
jgi:hypothetical protein